VAEQAHLGTEVLVVLQQPIPEPVGVARQQALVAVIWVVAAVKSYSCRWYFQEPQRSR
jgi:hypothetical protein